VHDASGKSILYVKQKMFRLKEKVEVFSDAQMKQKLFEINADRMLDFSANYRFTATDGTDWGTVRREGMRSLWAAHYDVYEEGRIDMTSDSRRDHHHRLHRDLFPEPFLSGEGIGWNACAAGDQEAVSQGNIPGSDPYMIEK